VAAALLGPQRASADEGGVSFWLPGQFGSLAATPQAPGWALGTIFYHTSVSAGGNVAAARQITIANSINDPLLEVSFKMAPCGGAGSDISAPARMA